jgi:GDP-4-dehydro-6-deoxy-D-mannose reductase
MRVLITGATGFAGAHLAEALATRDGIDLHAICRTAAFPPGRAALADRVSLHGADLTDAQAVTAILQRVQPQQIYHLAGYANAGQSLREPDEAWSGNLLATRRLYEAIVASGGKPRVLYVSSGLIYGDSTSPISETHPLRPANPYAASKAAADLLSYQVTRHPGLDVVIVRPFNHIGPHQSPQYAAASFARQLAEIEAGLQPPVIQTGDLRARRDLTDVRDMVQAYLHLMERGKSGEAYNAGSGTAVSIQSVLDQLRSKCRVAVEVRTDPSRLRLADTTATIADTAKIRDATQWTPRIPLAQTLADMLDYWRMNLSHPPR